MGHHKQLQFFEESLQVELKSEVQSPTISVAISRDSLDTWFTKVIDQLGTLSPINLEIISDDQEITVDYLRKGLVSACASTQPRPITGCHTTLLGYFDYVLVASPAFVKLYFTNKKDTMKNLLHAPSVIFDSKDYLHTRYLKKFFNISDAKLNQHVVPSVAGFRQFALKGYAYALIPEIDIIKELKQKKLIKLFPDKVWQMPVYWHSWAIENKNYKAFNSLIFKIARDFLRQESIK